MKHFILICLTFLFIMEPNSPLLAKTKDYYDPTGNKVSFEEFRQGSTFPTEVLDRIGMLIYKEGQDFELELPNGRPDHKWLVSLASVLDNEDWELAMSAAIILGSYGTQDVDIQVSLVKALAYPLDNGEGVANMILSTAVWALKKNGSKDNRVFNVLLNLFREQDRYRYETLHGAADVIGALSPRDISILRQLAVMYVQNLEKGKTNYMVGIFLTIRPQNEEILMTIVKAMEENPEDWRSAHVLANINPQSKKVLLAIADLMKSNDEALVMRAHLLLSALNPKDEDVLRIMKSCHPTERTASCG